MGDRWISEDFYLVWHHCINPLIYSVFLYFINKLSVIRMMRFALKMSKTYMNIINISLICNFNILSNGFSCRWKHDGMCCSSVQSSVQYNTLRNPLLNHINKERDLVKMHILGNFFILFFSSDLQPQPHLKFYQISEQCKKVNTGTAWSYRTFMCNDRYDQYVGGITLKITVRTGNLEILHLTTSVY